eukprot:30812-Pelagococcus_subviridis.AAC.3
MRQAARALTAGSSVSLHHAAAATSSSSLAASRYRRGVTRVPPSLFTASSASAPAWLQSAAVFWFERNAARSGIASVSPTATTAYATGTGAADPTSSSSTRRIRHRDGDARSSSPAAAPAARFFFDAARQSLMNVTDSSAGFSNSAVSTTRT